MLGIGHEEMALTRKDMTDAWRGILQGEINSEMDHILDYAGQIEQATANQAPIAPLMGRVALWVNRYQDVLNLALITSSKTGRPLQVDLRRHAAL